MSLTLTLDLGTKTGFSIGDSTTGTLLKTGTEVLAEAKELKLQRNAGKERTCDCRYVNLYGFIKKIFTEHTISTIIFEDVVFATSQAQAQLWASLRTVIWQLQIEFPNLLVHGVPVKTLKKFATNNGNADKSEMARALTLKLPEYTASIDSNLYSPTGDIVDDNEVDAIWLFYFATHMHQSNQSWTTIASNRQAKVKLKALKRNHKVMLRKFKRTLKLK